MLPSRVSLNKTLCKWENGLAGIGGLHAIQGKTTATNHPIFIIGTGRCGSTLFSRVLESHEDILIYPTEANNLFYPKTYPFRDAQIETPPILEDPGLYTELSVGAWPAGHENKIRNTLRGFQCLNRRGAVFMLKSAMISFLIPNLLRLFPEAKFIHLYRYGPSVVTSLVEKELHKYKTLATRSGFLVWAAGYWNSCIKEIDRANTEYSLTANGKLLELSYESFCDDPKGVSTKLARFVRCDPAKFTFDFSTVKSTNYKADAMSPDDLKLVCELMKSSLDLKGYLET
jgi:hypothetical protein